jgi:hypothetical protein
MARRVVSSIERLPAEVKRHLDELLRDFPKTQLEIRAIVNDELDRRGAEMRISRSSLSRYAQRMQAAGDKLRQRRAVAQAWVGELGEVPTGEVGRLLTELITNLAFDTAEAQFETGEPASAKVVQALARSVRDLELAAKVSAEREISIRRETARAAAKAAKGAARKAGLSAEAIATIERDVLGIIRAPAPG